MAQANSVQREPSMEEILASIRRIIEDSDTARKQVDESGEAEAAPELETAGEIEAFRGEFDEPDAGEPVKPASLAQIQAEVAREPRAGAAASESWMQPSLQAEAPAAHAEQAAWGSDAHAAEAAFADDEAHEPARAGNQNPRPAILSEQTGRQVAASFGELSAFAAGRRKSFDEMAEEMMRPMLQDWLDNNLPLLVERLVREEIERVARGGGS